MIMVSIVLEMREVIAIGRSFEGSDLSPFWGDRENVGEFPRQRENTKILGKLEKLAEKAHHKLVCFYI